MLQGKTALVTGSTSGIGLGIAIALARQGASVVLNGFGDSATPRAQVQQAGRAHDARVGYHGADMSKPDEIEAMMAYAASEFGGVDILVNNAGIQHVAPVEDFPAAKWDAIIAINLSSAFHTMRLAIPRMRRMNWGRIINIASTQGLVGSTGKVAYVAAKHGIVGMTKVVALETATTSITANAICPGYVLTPLVQQQVHALAAREGVDDDEGQRRFIGDKHPSLQFTTPEQLGELTVFLCSPAAANVKGAAWAMDGGWTAQ